MTKWGISARFRFQDNGWYMIGYTASAYQFSGLTESEDYNLLTGTKIIKTYDESGKSKEEKTNRGKKKLLNLLDYNDMILETDF
jgi:hypothetical protein